MGDLNVGETGADDVYISGTIVGSFAITSSVALVQTGSVAITTDPVPTSGTNFLPIIDASQLRTITWKGPTSIINPTESTPQWRTIWNYTTPINSTWRPISIHSWSDVQNVSFRLAERITLWRSKWGSIGSPEVLGATTFIVSPGSPGLEVGSFFYKINAMTNAGESVPTSSNVIITTAGSQRVRITTPVQAKGVCWWGIYRTGMNDIQGNEGFIEGIPAYAGASSIYDDVHGDEDINPTEGWPAGDNTARQIDVSGTNNQEIGEITCVFNEAFPQNQKIQFYYLDHANRRQFYEHDPGTNTAVGDGFDLLINRDGNSSSNQVAFPRPPAIDQAAYLGSARTYQRIFLRDITNVETTPIPTGAAFSVYGYRPLLYTDLEISNTGVWKAPSFGIDLPGGTEVVLQTTGSTSVANIFVDVAFHVV